MASILTISNVFFLGKIDFLCKYLFKIFLRRSLKNIFVSLIKSQIYYIIACFVNDIFFPRRFSQMISAEKLIRNLLSVIICGYFIYKSARKFFFVHRELTAGISYE